MVDSFRKEVTMYRESDTVRINPRWGHRYSCDGGKLVKEGKGKNTVYKKLITQILLTD